MSHQSQLEESKYRNWVRGGLAYQYLKEGIAGFADDVVHKEHSRFLGAVKNTSGKACHQCNLETLRPLHKCKKDSKGLKMCQWDLSNCNCLSKTKTTLPCPNKICDVILEEILKSHGSKPPAPTWKNTDVHKWYTSPWEIAKCFINAPGYSDKTKAADIDVWGLLHEFINNKNLHAHLSCDLIEKNIFKKCLERRNEIIHSPAVELEDAAVTECIDDIIAILEDPKELAITADAKQAVSKLKQILKQSDYAITTDNEIEICRTALDDVTKKSDELKEVIQNAKAVIGDKSDVAYEETERTSRGSWNQRYDQLARTTTNIKQKLICLGSKVDKLDVIRQNIQEQFDFVKEKQEFQKKLVSFYKENYVQTSTSPLKLQENDINISEVYIDSEMNVKDRKENTNREPRHGSNRIHNYEDIIYTNCQRNKSIYIEGDAGTGKSTLCKMMIQNWCSAVTSDADKTEVPQDLEQQEQHQVQASNATNIEELRKFDFLFFLPLGKMGGYTNITEMIKAVVTKAALTTADFIGRIFEQDSERCLIVADSLDEWKPDHPSVLQHVGYGLPERGKAKNATMVTFSRPSAKGLLNLASSACDLRVNLTGINKNHIQNFVTKYLSKFENTDESLDEFMDKIRLLCLEDLENSPLLLQQLVWLYCNGFEIGKSRREVYCQIVNIMFRWSENKVEESEEDSNPVANSLEMQLPTPLREFRSINAKKGYVVKLGKVAFESLTSEIGSDTFNRSRLKENGLSSANINKLIELGILIEEKCYDPTQDKTQLTFIHMFYLEFFAAVYACCRLDNHPSDKITSVLKDLFQNCKTAEDILQLSNLFKMICRICPFLISDVSHYISDLVKMDKSITRDNTGFVIVPSLDQMQQLMFSIIRECNAYDERNVYLSDAIILSFGQTWPFRRIILDNVVSFHTFNGVGRTLEWVTHMTQLQYLHIGRCTIPHVQMSLLSSFISGASLKCLGLTNLECEQPDCRDHSIDLSKHERLQKLAILECDRIRISNINTEQLETVKLSSTLSLDIGRLQNARSLTELILGVTIFSTSYRLIYNRQVDCIVHTFDQLQTLRICLADFEQNALTVTPEMKNLKHIYLHYVEMSLQTWRSFVESLLTLHQSVQVNTSDHRTSPSMKDRNEYVREKKDCFEVIEDPSNESTLRRAYFCFRTRNY